MNTYFAGALALLVLAGSAPLPVQAQTPPVGYYVNHLEDDEEEVKERETRFSRERYSRTTQRAINNLDDDVVERMPVPVLFVPYAKIYSDFGDPRDGGARSHEGQDIIAARGAFVVSPTDAVVTRTGKGGSAGVYVYTANPGGESFRYMHLDAIADGVKSGTVLKAGDLIGYVGNTGNASGGTPHLHFEIRDGRTAQDPYPRISGSFTNEELIRSLTAIVKVLQERIREMR